MPTSVTTNEIGRPLEAAAPVCGTAAGETVTAGVGETVPAVGVDVGAGVGAGVEDGVGVGSCTMMRPRI